MEIKRGSLEQELVGAVAWRISSELRAERKVVWLVDGNDNMSSAVAIMNLVRTAPLNKLVILLANEHFDKQYPVGINWLNLKHIGFYEATATAVPILRSGLDSRDAQEIVNSYEHLLKGYLQDADKIIGLFTLGSKGSLASIAARSEAANPGVHDVVSHQDGDIVSVSVTANVMLKVQVAFVNAIGPTNQLALDELRSDEPVRQDPAQILKRLSEVYIYN
jgi:hypothetical protein